MKTTVVCWGYIGIMEESMENAVVYWGYMLFLSFLSVFTILMIVTQNML